MVSRSISDYSDLNHYRQTVYNISGLYQQNYFLGDYFMVVRNDSALPYGSYYGAV